MGNWIGVFIFILPSDNNYGMYSGILCNQTFILSALFCNNTNKYKMVKVLTVFCGTLPILTAIAKCNNIHSNHIIMSSAFHEMVLF